MNFSGLATVFLNAMVLKNMRKPRNKRLTVVGVYIINMIMADLARSCTGFPVIIPTFFGHGWKLQSG